MPTNVYKEAHQRNEDGPPSEQLLTDLELGRKFYEYYRDVRGFDPAHFGDWQRRYGRFFTGDCVVSGLMERVPVKRPRGERPALRHALACAGEGGLHCQASRQRVAAAAAVKALLVNTVARQVGADSIESRCIASTRYCAE